MEHDSEIVYLPDGRTYVIVVLSKQLKDGSKGKRVIAEVSKKIYEYMNSKDEHVHRSR